MSKVKVGLGVKRASKKENVEVKNLQAKIDELEKENAEAIKNVEALQKENEALKADVAKLKK